MGDRTMSEAQPLRFDIASDIPADAIDRMLLRVRLRAQLRVMWLRTLWRRENELEARRVVSHAQVDAVLESWDTEEAQAAFQRGFPAARAAAERLDQAETAIRADSESRLATLSSLFSLTAAEMDVLHACLASSLDPSLGRVFAYLQDIATRTYVTEELASALFGHGFTAVMGADSALRRWQLVVEEPVAPGEPPALAVDPLIRAWLLGGHHLDEALVGIAQPVPAANPLAGWEIEAAAGRIDRLLQDGARVRVIVRGTPGAGRRTLAACVAARLGLRLLAVDSDAGVAEGWPALVLRAERQAFLDRSALAWTGDRATSAGRPQQGASFPLQFLIVEDGQPVAPAVGLAEEVLRVPPLCVGDRVALWHQIVPEARTWPDEAVAALASRYRLTPRDFAALAPLRLSGPDAAAARVRETVRHRLGELAQWIDCPFGWDDIVLPASLRAALDDLVYEAEARAGMWENPAARRLFPQGRGLFALLAGPPGTGKTMAAQVIARSLGLDLFRISLSEVVSKYVGETAKNMQRIFARAEAMDAVLLFDEADALFSRRTEVKDAHDRFANTDTNHLLQAVESYGGVALLATNRKANIDPAFLRRIRYVLDFPKPGAAERRALWVRFTTELSGAAPDDVLGGILERLADSVEATGAQIKYAVLSGLYAAQRDVGPMTIGHLLRGLERELLKEGRALSERDRERLSAP
jgi:adenylate kinase family enzyme